MINDEDFCRSPKRGRSIRERRLDGRESENWNSDSEEDEFEEEALVNGGEMFTSGRIEVTTDG